jgi:hypothetical protein
LKAQFIPAGLILTSIFSLTLTGSAQVNSWTSPASGNWHDPSWSLGVLPNSSQSHIVITNSGWKAVAINRATALNHPDSLNIRNLTVSSPADSFNTLMLNFSGREWPLRIAQSFHLGSNSVFRTLDSGLHVGDVFMIDGTVIHTDFSEVSASSILIGNTAPPPPSEFQSFVYSAEYNLTNGSLTVSDRLFIGVSSLSVLRQYGGSNHVRELRLGFGDYQFRGGTLAANTLRIGSPSASFIQLAGDVSVANPVIIGENDGLFEAYFLSNNIQGNYHMRGGTFRAPAIRLGTPNDASNPGAQGNFNQEGGTNITATLHVGAGGMGNTLRCGYTLWAGGFLHTSSTTVGPGFDASFSQGTGLHLIDGPLILRGVRDPSAPFITRPFYTVGSDSILRCHSLTVDSGEFHSDGTNEIAGDLLLTSSPDMYTAFTLHGGWLTAANTIARLGRVTNDCFFHRDGVHIVTGLLDLAASSPDGVVYELNDGLLVAPDIRITNGVFLHYRGGSISNSGTITLAGAEWEETIAGSTHLGALRLQTAPRHSMISLTHTLATMHFLPSAAVAWAPGARLLIKFWNGAANGGGNHQIIFGNSSGSLTPQQLSQIRFLDPAGFAPGEYPARILSTGEIVPAAAGPPDQVNSWTSPASGNWHDPSWSLGVLPNSSQSHIMITNSGWKAVAINRTTALNHPDSLNISNLTVSSPSNSFNTFMLNFSGREWPLRIAESFHLGSNSVFRTLDSGLQVGNVFMVDGTVIHTDFSEVIAPSLNIGNIVEATGAEYNLTNGILSVPSRLFLGPLGFATFRQHGGSNRVSEFRLGTGLYELHAGHVVADTFKSGSFSSVFQQYGGDVSVTNALLLGENHGILNPPNNIWGTYYLSDGTLRTPSLRVGTPNDASGLGGGEGYFTQFGGSNFAARLHVGAGGSNNTFRAVYSLMGGLLHTSATAVGSGYDVAFSQSGGLHLVDGPVTLSAVFASPFPFQGTMYELSGGTLRSHSVTISESFFYHINGTNDVAGDLLLGPSTQLRQAEYALLAGRLSTSNTFVRSGWGRGFRQGGGVHQVNRLLELSGHTGSGGEFVICEFNGGRIIAPDIRVANGAFLHSDSGVISNRGTITLAGARWSESTPNTSFGALRLESAAAANSIISLSAASATVRFLSSAAQPWAPDARLLIDYWWRGSTNGGGDHQVIFGNSSSALTAQQLSQIGFRDPAGFPPGEYPARILATGEIVPTAGAQPPVMFTRNGSGVVLQWPDGYTLQTATNMSGPFIDINNASPYEIQTGADRQRYFRLRR